MLEHICAMPDLLSSTASPFTPTALSSHRTKRMLEDDTDQSTYTIVLSSRIINHVDNQHGRQKNSSSNHHRETDNVMFCNSPPLQRGRKCASAEHCRWRSRSRLVSFVKPEFSLIAHRLGFVFHNTFNLTRDTEDPVIPLGPASTFKDHATTGDAQLAYSA